MTKSNFLTAENQIRDVKEFMSKIGGIDMYGLETFLIFSFCLEHPVNTIFFLISSPIFRLSFEG